jgi:hypothetical protein
MPTGGHETLSESDTDTCDFCHGDSAADEPDRL